MSIEGTRSYGIGVARAAAAARLMMLECEQPARRTSIPKLPASYSGSSTAPRRYRSN
jgi:hypothetical protein